jgi:hypothetical protein
MKRFLPWPVVMLSIALIASCKKEKQDDSQIIICPGPGINNYTYKTVVLNANESYNYDLGSFGDEEGVVVHQQAKHYTTSAIERTGNVVYHYQPAQDFTGTDSVVLKSVRGSNSGSVNTTIWYTVIQFTITSHSSN